MKGFISLVSGVATRATITLSRFSTTPTPGQFENCFTCRDD
jgi:hypothetical protein